MSLPSEERYAWIKKQNSNLDPRLTLARPDIAEVALKDELESGRYTTPKAQRVSVALADLKREPTSSAPLLTQAVMGEKVDVLLDVDGWSFARLCGDGYVGYIKSSALTPHSPLPTHKVSVPMTHVYAKPDLKTAQPLPLPFLSQIAIGGAPTQNGFVEVKGQGWVYNKHLVPLDQALGDRVETALTFLHTPYLWGGRSCSGIDCSALVQLVLQAAGQACPRDTDLQNAQLGTLVSRHFDPALGKRGDLVFFPGHVGMLINSQSMIHANATRMKVSIDTVATVMSWLEGKVEEPFRSIRRLPE